MVYEQKTLYVQTDKGALNNCKNVDFHKMCKRHQPSYLVSGTNTCNNQIIRTRAKSLDYIVVPKEEIELNIFCDKNSQQLTLSEAIFLETDGNCILHTNSMTIKLQKLLKSEQSFTTPNQLTYRSMLMNYHC